MLPCGLVGHGPATADLLQELAVTVAWAGLCLDLLQFELVAEARGSAGFIVARKERVREGQGARPSQDRR